MADITVSLIDTIEMASDTELADNKQEISDSVSPSGVYEVTNDSVSTSSSLNVATSGYLETIQETLNSDVHFSPTTPSGVVQPTPSGSSSINLSEGMDKSVLNSVGDVDIVLLNDYNIHQANISINSPAPSGTFIHRDRILFDADVRDPVTDAPVPSGLRWYSSIDGIIGDGETLYIESLSMGYHNIKVSASGYIGGKTIPISILPSSTPQRPENVGEL